MCDLLLLRSNFHQEQEWEIVKARWTSKSLFWMNRANNTESTQPCSIHINFQEFKITGEKQKPDLEQHKE